MGDLAYTAVLANTPNADGMYYRLVIAQRGIAGYSALKETGDASDPTYVQKGPIWFRTKALADAEAARRNTLELYLTERQAMEIVFSSIGAQMRGRV